MNYIRQESEQRDRSSYTAGHYAHDATSKLAPQSRTTYRQPSKRKRRGSVRELTLLLPDAPAPIYLRIVEAIRAAIQSGLIGADERVPATRELAHRLGASRNTVARALEELVAEGWLIARSRSGYYVNPYFPKESTKPKCKAVGDSVSRLPLFDWSSRYDSEITSPHESGYTSVQGCISFAVNGPDVRLFPLSELRQCLRKALRDEPLATFDYGNAMGYGPFIEVATAYLRRARGIIDRELVITSGSTEARLLVCQLLLGPGKVVAMEELCFFPIYRQFQLAGLQILPLPLDEAGIIPEVFREIATRRTIDLLHLSPLHHYPTTTTLQEARRREIYEICATQGIPILEDDYDHEFHYRAQPPVPLAASDPLGLVIYVSSFSTSLFPSAKLGCLAVPRQLAGALSQIRRATAHHGSNFLQAAMAHWIDEGGFERHIKRTRMEYAGRLRHLMDCLSDLAKSGHALRFDPPEGGLGLWLDTHCNATEVANRGRLHGISLIPDAACRIPSGLDGGHIRLNFGCLSLQEISHGMELFAETLHELA